MKKPKQIDVNEAPEGFYAASKIKAPTPNVCSSCDARTLCQENKDDWCLKNRCMSYDIIATGKTYSRVDKQSVFFRQLPGNNIILR